MLSCVFVCRVDIVQHMCKELILSGVCVCKELILSCVLYV